MSNATIRMKRVYNFIFRGKKYETGNSNPKENKKKKKTR